jgi:hypothetical protein
VTQQASPVPPHAVNPVPHALAVQVPRAGVPPQVVPALTHSPATQQAPVPVHVCSGQHGWPDPPQAVVEVPLSQIVPVPLPVDAPEATQTVATQQPPPMHAVPVVQHDSPGEPQVTTAHCEVPASVVPHVPPLVHAAPDPTHSLVPGSQQSTLVVQVAPEQHVSVVAPQSTQVPAALHASPVPVHVSPAQHGSPFAAPHVRQWPPEHESPAPQVSPAQQRALSAPQAAHCPALHTAPCAVHVLPAQHGSPTAPHAPASVAHAPAVHVPPMSTGHSEPAAVHVEAAPAVAPGTQHPPAEQESPAQQVWLVPPHGLQVPGAAPVHVSVESQARPGQQSSPEPPHP